MDEELEDKDEVVEPHVQSPSSSEDEADAEETEVAFWATRAGDSSNFLNLTGPPNAINPLPALTHQSVLDLNAACRSKRTEAYWLFS